jgi:hypothetical protein
MKHHHRHQNKPQAPSAEATSLHQPNIEEQKLERPA